MLAPCRRIEHVGRVQVPHAGERVVPHRAHAQDAGGRAAREHAARRATAREAHRDGGNGRDDGAQRSHGLRAQRAEEFAEAVPRGRSLAAGDELTLQGAGGKESVRLNPVFRANNSFSLIAALEAAMKFDVPFYLNRVTTGDDELVIACT